MKIALAEVINLLHSVDYGVLATHSTQLPGHPFPTVLPFAPDERHCPLLLVSALAEHTKNLLADARASFLVYQPRAGDVSAGARASLIGSVTRINPSQTLIERYLRYQPNAARYLELADFAFFRLQPIGLRFIGGFGTMGWVEAESFGQAAWIALEQEAQLRAAAARPAALLGVDPYGADLLEGSMRVRKVFEHGPLAFEQLQSEVSRLSY